MDALRSGRSREYIPENLLPRDPYTGEISKGNPFDHRFIKVETAMGEDAKTQSHCNKLISRMKVI